MGLQKFTNSQIAEMNMPQLAHLLNQPNIAENTKRNIIFHIDDTIKAKMSFNYQPNRFDTLSGDEHKSNIKMWYVLKNDTKPQGWTLRQFSIDYVHEREIFQDHQLIKSRFKQEGIYFLKNFYGFGKPLHGYQFLYNFAMKLYKQGKLLQLRFYLNTLMEETQSGEFMPIEVQRWARAEQTQV
ncbi:hypothetical protein [Chondrinema litorale]|uniref:hypothetical protein n=1 Tax=Chondrinema litorale TaxID=2994555 RepID=UPI0025427689|nr:hypothetical protein [Chondrinema litorale]UZR93162.1 hypothetical protein OQ292_14980 [Chondrinema litorale]